MDSKESNVFVIAYVRMKTCVVHARDAVAKILKVCGARDVMNSTDLVTKTFGMLCLFAYAFLLRVPSEALPAKAGGSGKCVVTVEDEFVVVTLARRKNKEAPSRIERGCWCKECKEPCPRHVLGPFFQQFPQGTQVFEEYTPAIALKVLRKVMSILKVPRAAEYKTHDFRRGHAKDLQESGRLLV